MGIRYGTSGADTLSGDAGDVLSAGGGNDLYVVSSATVQIVEAAGGGADSVHAWSSYMLPSEVENLRLSTVMSTGVGNALDNHVWTTATRNTLIGGGGNDTLAEESGGSTVFGFAPGSGIDTVFGFHGADGDSHDFIQLSGCGLTGFADVATRLSQSGADVVLTLSPTDRVTFRSASLADFTADDFLLEVATNGVDASFSEEFLTLSLYDHSSATGTWKTNYWFGSQTGADAWNSRSNGDQALAVDPIFDDGTGTPLGLNPFGLSDGTVSISVARAAGDVLLHLHGRPLTSGVLTTEKSFIQTYGYFEMRAQLPQDQGLWPAFWLLPAVGGKKPEIDVFEQIGDGLSYATVHTSDPDSSTTTFTAYLPSAGDGMHTYGVLWTEDEITFYVDGVGVARMATPDDMHDPMYMIASLGAGGSWPGNVATDFESAEMTIDYIRAFSTTEMGGVLGYDLLEGSAETLTGGSGDDRIFGRDGEDLIFGGAGDDYIDGGAMADAMHGGAGNDTYVVDDAGDLIVEYDGQGTDEVRSYRSVTQPLHVERLVLLGTMDLSATGNAQDNAVVGNDGHNHLVGEAGRDTLEGGIGRDTLEGGSGDDTYVLASWYADGTDRVVEQSGGGYDTVISAITLSMIANIERLVLTGTENLEGWGNDLDNVILGNEGSNVLFGGSGSDRLEGGRGADTLTGDGGDTLAGGDGADTFRFGRWLGDNVITDFGRGADVIDLQALTAAGVAATWSEAGGDSVVRLGGEGSIRLTGVGLDGLEFNGGTVTSTSTVYSAESTTLGPGKLVLRLTGGQDTSGTGNEGNNLIVGNDGNNTLNGSFGADTLEGGGGNDRLSGEQDDDTLNGGIGADYLFGGTGSDTYYVDNIGDYVEDVSGTSGGYDSVQSAVTFTLGAYIETLTLVGRGAVNGTGNALGNSISGNEAANVLAGVDGNDSLYGNEGADRLEGGAGSDSLDGGDGNDQLYGGAGDDVYHNVEAGDQVFETAGGGIDEVRTQTTSWTLAGEIENLHLGYGSGALTGTGNAGANVIGGNYGNNTLQGLGGNDKLYGNLGNDTLYGDAGADTMYGDAAYANGYGGNDIFYVDNVGDRVVEHTNEGFDKVHSSVSYTLGANVETLRMFGTGLVNATGNGLDNELWGTSSTNMLRGMAGVDRIESGGGADTVIGGLGNDQFIYASAVVSNPAARDTLTAGDGAAAFDNAGAGVGDVLDFSAFDANTQAAGVQDFAFGTLTGIGRLWAVNSGATTLIRGNTDSDAIVEFEVAIADGAVLASAYKAADFIV